MLDVDQYLHAAIVNIERYIPGIYNKLDNARDKLITTPMRTWEDYVYFPQVYSDPVVIKTDLYDRLRIAYSDTKDDIFNAFAKTFKSFIFFMYNWRLNKKVYKFNRNFSKILSERTNVDQILDLHIIDILKNLPYNSIAVSAHINDEICGFISTMDFVQMDDFAGYALKFNGLRYDQLEDPERDMLFNIGKTYCILIAGNTTIRKVIEDGRIVGGNEAASMIYILLYILSLDISHDKHTVKVFDLGKGLSPRIKDRYKDIDVVNVNNTVSDVVLKSIEDDRVHAHFEYSVIDGNHVFDWVVDSNNEDDIAELRSKIEELELELCSTKIDLDNANIEINRYKSMYEELAQSIESERKQLYDLRKSIFDYQENGTSNIANLNITFPYRPSKRIVVFGGHDTWAKEIKPRLPGVRFIERHMTPNQDTIKCADEVWIQNNALSHSAFYTIMNYVRKANVPVKYFSYASAVKCAEQLVKDDMGIS